MNLLKKISKRTLRYSLFSLLFIFAYGLLAYWITHLPAETQVIGWFKTTHLVIFAVFSVCVLILIVLEITSDIRRYNTQGPPVEDLLSKYNIKTDADAFRLINNPKIPTQDRGMIARYQELLNRLNS